MYLLVSTASAQVKPPNVKDTDGNQYVYPVLIFEPPQPRKGLEVDPRRGRSAAAAIQQKMAGIIIPHLEFHDAPLSDAIEFIRQESRRLDLDPDTDNRGLNIFLKLPKDMSASSAVVTAELTDVSVLDALKAVAEKVGLKVEVEPYAVSMVPFSENTDPMVTATLLLPPEALGFPAVGPSPSLSEFEPRRDAKEFLESKGITFPPGASAVYLPTVQKLVIRNTAENIKVVKVLFASFTATIAPNSP